MIVLGDVSGIQSYVFAVPEAGGGQARRLRARSLLVQGLAECTARFTLDRLGWQAERAHFPFTAAGKFILHGESHTADLDGLTREINADLLRRTGGALRVALADGVGPTEGAAYGAAADKLRQVKAAPWRPAVAWNPADLVLAPLGTPCDLCRRERGEVTDRDPDTNAERLICRTCHDTYWLGQRMPGKRAVRYRRGGDGGINWLGYSGTLVEKREEGDRDMRAGIPVEQGKPVEFVEMAKRATGDQLLAVLKADVDSLGEAVDDRLRSDGDLAEFLAFADKLDRFFAGKLQDVIETGRRPIYSVFAGGDDLVMIGPWDEMARFAGEVRELFRKEFPDLTLSAGLALFKPKRPVKTAVEQAERLLEQAKGEPKKDSCAALGQAWKWDHHATILAEAERLAGWVPNQVQRGWLHTLLALAEARHGPTPDPMATARLAYHVGRNWKAPEARAWADEVVRRFDDSADPKVRYLPAALRHALTATRKPDDRE
jgi:CRISPR-associated protein Csm1